MNFFIIIIVLKISLGITKSWHIEEERLKMQSREIQARSERDKVKLELEKKEH